eukprot:11187024-Karenia_brevis.AAC.1
MSLMSLPYGHWRRAACILMSLISLPYGHSRRARHEWYLIQWTPIHSDELDELAIWTFAPRRARRD